MPTQAIHGSGFVCDANGAQKGAKDPQSGEMQTIAARRKVAIPAPLSDAPNHRADVDRILQGSASARTLGAIQGFLDRDAGPQSTSSSGSAATHLTTLPTVSPLSTDPGDWNDRSDDHYNRVDKLITSIVANLDASNGSEVGQIDLRSVTLNYDQAFRLRYELSVRFEKFPELMLNQRSHYLFCNPNLGRDVRLSLLHRQAQ